MKNTFKSIVENTIKYHTLQLRDIYLFDNSEEENAAIMLNGRFHHSEDYPIWILFIVNDIYNILDNLSTDNVDDKLLNIMYNAQYANYTKPFKQDIRVFANFVYELYSNYLDKKQVFENVIDYFISRSDKPKSFDWADKTTVRIGGGLFSTAMSAYRAKVPSTTVIGLLSFLTNDLNNNNLLTSKFRLKFLLDTSSDFLRNNNCSVELFQEYFNEETAIVENNIVTYENIRNKLMESVKR